MFPSKKKQLGACTSGMHASGAPIPMLELPPKNSLAKVGNHSNVAEIVHKELIGIHCSHLRLAQFADLTAGYATPPIAIGSLRRLSQRDQPRIHCYVIASTIKMTRYHRVRTAETRPDDLQRQMLRIKGRLVHIGAHMLVHINALSLNFYIVSFDAFSPRFYQHLFQKNEAI